MNEKLSTHQQFVKIIETFQSDDGKGDGGCFMEIYREAKNLAGIANAVGDNGTIKYLSTLVKSLPPVQNDKSVALARQNIDKIRAFVLKKKA